MSVCAKFPDRRKNARLLPILALLLALLLAQTLALAHGATHLFHERDTACDILIAVQNHTGNASDVALVSPPGGTHVLPPDEPACWSTADRIAAFQPRAPPFNAL